MVRVVFRKHNLSEYKCNGIGPAKSSQTGATSANYNLLLMSKTSLDTYCKEVFLFHFPS